MIVPRWLAALLLALSPLAAHAEERVRDFHSDVRIAKDGTLTVVETITVAVEGDRIKRGIQRDFPTDYRSRLGQTTRVAFDVRSVIRDGQPEPYEMMGLSNGERIRMSTSPDSRAKLSRRDTDDREVESSLAIAPIVRSCV